MSKLAAKSTPPTKSAGSSHAWLVIGLGNPGSEYQNTRHNIGFLVVDAIAKRHAVTFKKDRLSQSELAVVHLDNGAVVHLAKPQTFMNLSGRSAASLCATYRIGPERVIVVSDDVALPFGTLRIRLGGSAGGHNGLKSLIGAISDRFVRFRVGVNAPPPQVPLEAYVLQRFSQTETKALAALVDGIATEVLTSLHESTLSERTLALLPQSSNIS
ncbi:aminoacyl-tRNA hydrolase [Patescibacteria group bacterium]|nr:aminoacyl-tRNA hydrolase [Patescibacteria group bacterium]